MEMDDDIDNNYNNINWGYKKMNDVKAVLQTP